MPGALQAGGPPPVPQPQQNAALGQGGPAPQPGQPQVPQAPPAPTHAQTVAALRHFQAIVSELRTLASNPDLGKSDIRDAFIDGMTKLVADRMVAPPQAVQQLSTIPDKPLDQKKWVMTHMQQTLQARDAVLVHHAAAFAGQPAQEAPDADQHMQDISGMMQQHYGQGAQ